MAKYGARYLKFAPFAATNPEPANAYPNYGASTQLMKLVKVSDSPNLVEAKHYADDELDEYVAEIGEADLDIEVSDISTDQAAAILGAAKDEQTGDVAYGEDAAPYGGLGFVSCKMVSGVRSYVGVYYPKADFDTTFGLAHTVEKAAQLYVAARAANGKWKVISAGKTSPELAKAWVDQKLGAST